jgi:phospholipid transport system transporter-binding protein
MILREGNKINIHGPVVIDNAVAMTKQGVALLTGGHLTVDFSKVEKVDSSIVSMLLEWLREANRLGCQLHFVNVSESLKSLIQLYGVAELFSLN